MSEKQRAAEQPVAEQKSKNHGGNSPVVKLMRKHGFWIDDLKERIKGLLDITDDQLVKTLSPLERYYHKDSSILFSLIKKMLIERDVSPETVEEAFAFAKAKLITPADLIGKYGYFYTDIVGRMQGKGYKISRQAVSRSLNPKENYKHQRHELLQLTVKEMLIERNCSMDEIEKIIYQKHSSILGGIEMLPKNVLQFWDFERQPFINELGIENGIFLTPNHQEVLDEIENAATCMGFIYVVGDIGSGKTTVARLAINQIKENHKSIKVIFLEEPEEEKLLIHDIYVRVLDFIGVRAKPKSTALKLGMLKERLEKLYDDGFTTFIVVDESQSLKWQTIEGFKKLYDTYSGFNRIVSIALFGTPELKNKIEDIRVESTALRLSPVEIKPLGDFTPRYVEHKIKNAGGSMDIFDMSALVELCNRKLSMKAVNKIISRALVEAAEMKVKKVDSRFIKYF